MRILLLLCLALPALGADVEQHIIGGSATTIDLYPHQLSLRENGIHTCGASLIGETRAVTTAYCVGAAIGTYTIVGGTTDRTVSDCSNCISRDLNLLNRHPDWDQTVHGWPNDIAVLGFLAVTFNPDLQAIALATPSDGLFVGEACTITGWGKISATSPDPDILQQAQMTVSTNLECGNLWGALLITDGHLCAQEALTSACTSDQGGPLECGNILVGAASWAEASCDTNFPSVFTRIGYFQPWIILQ